MTEPYGSDPDVADERLLGAVADGDETALQALYRRHASWLVLRLTRRCSDPDLVDQVVQDTFASMRGLASSFTRMSLASWSEAEPS